MDFPIRCQYCGYENWIDLNCPIIRPVNNLVVVEEYICKKCNEKIPFFYYTRSLEEALFKLRRCNIHNKNFMYFFNKILKKSQGIREKYGPI